jgi:hypothetical protein
MAGVDAAILGHSAATSVDATYSSFHVYPGNVSSFFVVNSCPETPTINFPDMPPMFPGTESDLESLGSPPVIIESSAFHHCCDTTVNHHIFVVDFERLDVIDRAFSAFSHLQESKFEIIQVLR